MKEKVFVVYGRNIRMRKALFDLLRSANLQPMEWEHIVALTESGAPYIGDVLDKGFEVAQAVVILFTGDDLAQLNPELLSEDETAEELTPQPRPNVIMEAGMALGKDSTRTIIVQIGNIREISDLQGRHVVNFKNTPKCRKTLLSRLETAGCNVDFRGDDWLSSGNF